MFKDNLLSWGTLSTAHFKKLKLTHLFNNLIHHQISSIQLSRFCITYIYIYQTMIVPVTVPSPFSGRPCLTFSTGIFITSVNIAFSFSPTGSKHQFFKFVCYTHLMPLFPVQPFRLLRSSFRACYIL